MASGLCNSAALALIGCEPRRRTVGDGRQSRRRRLWPARSLQLDKLAAYPAVRSGLQGIGGAGRSFPKSQQQEKSINKTFDGRSLKSAYEYIVSDMSRDVRRIAAALAEHHTALVGDMTAKGS